jgi:uncharacterized protein
MGQPGEQSLKVAGFRTALEVEERHMGKQIRITAGAVTASANLNESVTAKAIWDALPIEGLANRWGEEIYFEIPVSLAEDPDARQDMAVGELAYWPPGFAFCIFFGPTPVSRGGVPRAYSDANPVGMLEGDATAFRSVKDGAQVLLARL